MTVTPHDKKHEHITEDEASLYDRQIRLWGLEAQNRMRSATILLLSLRSLAHETIKNLVLAGIGTLIVMDDGVVTEEDLGSGFLFREEEGAVGKPRTEAALPQIASLNPLVKLVAHPTLAPFVPDPEGGAQLDPQQEMADFLVREGVDVVVACDMTRVEIERINSAARSAGAKMYAAGTYGYCGYVFADLGTHDFVVTPPSSAASKTASTVTASTLLKKTLTYVPFSSILDRTGWNMPLSQAGKSGSPYRGMSRTITNQTSPGAVTGLLALWEFERRHGALPEGKDGEAEEMASIAEELRIALGVNEKAFPKIDTEVVNHLALHATATFPPTLAILGGFLAQDVLRAVSKKDKPIANLLVVDSWGGSGAIGRWGMDDMRDA